MVWYILRQDITGTRTQQLCGWGNIVRREDIKVDFIWDIVQREGKKVCVLNVPFVVPPYCFNVDFRPVGFGLSINEREWQEGLER